MGRKMSQAQLRRELDEIYAQVPAIDCRGKCADTCTEFPVSRLEQRIVRGVSGKDLLTEDPRWPTRGRLKRRCPMLTGSGRCSVYDVRPLICRLWGVAEPMPCNYGCKTVDGVLLPIRRMYELLAQVYRVSDQPSVAGVFQRAADMSDDEARAFAPVLKAYAWGKIDLAEGRRRMGAKLDG
jgi:Fe-S-cluster containining protein